MRTRGVHVNTGANGQTNRDLIQQPSSRPPTTAKKKKKIGKLIYVNDEPEYTIITETSNVGDKSFHS